MSGPLPAALASLEPYMAHWARATEYERMAARIAATPAQIKSFYDAALHVLHAAKHRVITETDLQDDDEFL